MTAVFWQYQPYVFVPLRRGSVKSKGEPGMESALFNRHLRNGSLVLDGNDD
jgi:hypothetical protein